MRERLANAALFQPGWFTCVLGGDSPWLLLGMALFPLLHLMARYLPNGRLRTPTH